MKLRAVFTKGKLPTVSHFGTFECCSKEIEIDTLKYIDCPHCGRAWKLIVDALKRVG